jgi:hypothetical protein
MFHRTGSTCCLPVELHSLIEQYGKILVVQFVHMVEFVLRLQRRKRQIVLAVYMSMVNSQLSDEAVANCAESLHFRACE